MMKIKSPWPYNLVRLSLPSGEVLGVQSGRELEFDVEEVLLEPVRVAGRGGKLDTLGPGKIWSKAWGINEVEDHLKKVKILEGEKNLELAREKEAKRKAKEARERTLESKVIKEKPTKVIDHKLDLGNKLEM